MKLNWYDELSQLSSKDETIFYPPTYMKHSSVSW